MQDVETYLSPTRYKPLRLVVQAAPHVLKDRALPNTDWRRRELVGSVPVELKIAEWALQPGDPDPNGKVTKYGKWERLLRMMIVAMPLQIYLALPGLGVSWDDNADSSFPAYPGHSWDWPKHANNHLDQRPLDKKDEAKEKMFESDRISSRVRLQRPRRLVVCREDGSTALTPNPDPTAPFVFISYTRWHFKSPADRAKLEKIAALVTRDHESCGAYWQDAVCLPPLKTLESDIRRDPFSPSRCDHVA